ncbi:MAG: polyol transport system substrate-binding protein, partial [Actinomycetota bacterium]|nr:polyol transport system substrate-binding protein [Actinomycetota bacterium]
MRRSAPDGAAGPRRRQNRQNPQRRRRARLPLLALLAVALLGAVAGCAGAGAVGGDAGAQTVTVAIVSNPQMEDAISLAPQFEAENPGIRLRFVSLSENEARAKITASVATGGGEFDIVMISNYETPQWAQNGWLTDL